MKLLQSLCIVLLFQSTGGFIPSGAVPNCQRPCSFSSHTSSTDGQTQPPSHTHICLATHTQGEEGSHETASAEAGTADRLGSSGSKASGSTNPLSALGLRLQRSVGRAVTTGLVAMTAVTALTPLGALAEPDYNPVVQLTKQATAAQEESLKKAQAALFSDVANRAPESVLAKVVVVIASDTFPLGFPDISAFPKLDNPNACLIATAFGKAGPPVAAKRMKLQGLKFPVVFEITDDDLAFPLTKEAWKKDARSMDEIGVAVVLDVDGKLATLDPGALTGYGISKIFKFGGQAERVETKISVNPARTTEDRGQGSLNADEVLLLERLDSTLDFKESQANKGIKRFGA